MQSHQNDSDVIHLLAFYERFEKMHIYSVTHCDRPFHREKKVAESISAASENLLNMTGSFRFSLWELPLHLQNRKTVPKFETFRKQNDMQVKTLEDLVLFIIS